MIHQWAAAIKKFEGWRKGSRSYRNNNPGNIRYARQRNAAPDTAGYAVFASYEAGYSALVRMLRRAASGQSRIYHPDMTLKEFFAVYAPHRDGNDPTAYAQFVADQLSIPPSTQISALL